MILRGSQTKRERHARGLRSGMQRLLAAAFVVAVPLSSEAAPHGHDARTFAIASAPAFAHYRQALVKYLHGAGAASATRVYLLGEEGRDGSKVVWVIWPAGDRMILWGGGISTMILSRRILDLRTDVAASTADIRGSTYLATRSWVARQWSICHRLDTQVEVGAMELKLGAAIPHRVPAPHETAVTRSTVSGNARGRVTNVSTSAAKERSGGCLS